MTTRGAIPLTITARPIEPGEARLLTVGVNGNAYVRAFDICCPGCGDRLELAVSVRRPGDDIDAPRRPVGWTWDGNVKTPTLVERFEDTDGCGWRGYLKAGVWMPEYGRAS